jgi:hypothetical protein
MGSPAILQDHRLESGSWTRNHCFLYRIIIERVEEGKCTNFFLILIQEHKAMGENNA